MSLALGFAVVLGGLVPAYAALDLTAVSFDTAPIFTIASLVIAAFAGIWAIRKVIQLVRG
jgi:hypothetical protein